jgi:hypothetical protein
MTALDVVRAYQDAWTKRDFTAAAEYLAEDFVHVSPNARYDTVDGFLAMLTAFGARIGTGWRPVAEFGDETSALIMYELFTTSGAPLPLTVDHFVVRDGKLVSETLVFDTVSFAAALARQ